MDFSVFGPPGRPLAGGSLQPPGFLIILFPRIPYSRGGRGRGGFPVQGLLSSDSSPLLQVVEALIQSSLLYGAEIGSKDEPYAWGSAA